MMPVARLLSAIVVPVALLAAASTAATAQSRGKFKRLDVPFAGTPHAAVALMLKLAGVGPDDIVYDLGSGDGRIVITAVRDFGARKAVGVDIDAKRVYQGMQNAWKAGVDRRVQFYHDDVFRFDFGEATVLTTFMSTRINTELLPRMRELLKPGTRIVTFRFPILGWKPDKVITHEGDDIHLWVMTAEDKEKQ